MGWSRLYLNDIESERGFQVCKTTICFPQKQHKYFINLFAGCQFMTIIAIYLQKKFGKIKPLITSVKCGWQATTTSGG